MNPSPAKSIVNLAKICCIVAVKEEEEEEEVKEEAQRGVPQISGHPIVGLQEKDPSNELSLI